MKASLAHLGIDAGVPFPPAADAREDDSLAAFIEGTDVFDVG